MKMFCFRRKMKFKLISLTTIVLLVTVFSGLALGETLKVGVAWAGKSGMAKRVTKGLEKGLKELAPQIKLEFHKELADITALGKVIDKYQKSKTGMVILRSNGAKYLGKNPPGIPTFIGGCNHPGQLGAIKNLDAPEDNVTGVTYFLPAETQFEVFQAILPNMQSIVLLTEKGHPGSAIDEAGTRQVCRKMGLKCTFTSVANKGQVKKVVKQNQGQVSAIVIGNQALLLDMTTEIVGMAGKTPILSYSAKPVKDGALGGFAADDEKLGTMLAESIVSVLVNGQSIKSTPVKMDANPKFFLNVTTAQKLGLEVPFDILELATVVE